MIIFVLQSDDDHNTTTSDIDSQPRTPATPYMFSEMDDESTQFTEDGLFKIPRIRNDSVSLTEVFSFILIFTLYHA